MALVVTSGSQSASSSGDPTAPLATALREFEAILSEKQRLLFRSNYTKPEAADVVVFVSRIDADNKTRLGRCVAPRLCTFLECTVQFTNVVDTFVQSNPTIAALVWGGVKTAILTVVNYASYFDKVTLMLMRVSRSCPTYQKFGELYPGSIELQSALCDYYTKIVRLCLRIVQASQRSGISRLLCPMVQSFDLEFRDILDDLAQNAKEIDIHVSLASKKAVRDEAQLAELERKENASHRKVMALFKTDWQRESDGLRMQRLARHAEKMRLNVRRNICSVDKRSSTIS